jgi:hypothetical protein
MAVTHATALRTAIADLVDDYCNAGSGAAKLKIRNSSNTVLATITLADPAFGAGSAGAVALAGLPKSDSSADATGTAANFIITDSDDNTVISGTVTATGGGGDLTLDSVSITAGQVVTITSGTYTAPS